jgi:hypothetical protein
MWYFYAFYKQEKDSLFQLSETSYQISIYVLLRIIQSDYQSLLFDFRFLYLFSDLIITDFPLQNQWSFIQTIVQFNLSTKIIEWIFSAQMQTYQPISKSGVDIRQLFSTQLLFICGSISK